MSNPDPAHTSDNQTAINPPQSFKRFFTNTPIIGLTGGIGSGKTAVSNWFIAQGIDVVDADVVSHEITQKGSPTLDKLVKSLGDWVIDDSGNMDRNAVREQVFTNNKSLLILESITHPAIRQRIKQQLTSATSDYVILSAPLLLESAEGGLASLCDRVLVVDVPEATQIKRASSRDTKTVDEITAIMDNQLSRQERLKYANEVVDNSGSLEELHDKLEPLHQQYLSLGKKN